MTWITLLALTLLGIQCLSIYLAAQAVLFPLAVFSAGIICALFQKHFRLNPAKTLWISAFILSLGAIRFILFNRNILSAQIPEYANIFGSYDNAYLVAQIFLGLQLVNLSAGISGNADAKTIFTKPLNAATYFFLAVSGQLCIMDRMLDNELQIYVHLLVLPFAGVCGFYILACTPASNGAGKSRFSLIYWVATILLLGISGLLALFVSASLHRNQLALDSFFFSTFGGDRQSVLGFSREARLGSLAIAKRTDPDAVALRVIAEDAPGYLRGMVYDRYERTVWLNTLEKTNLLPVTPIPTEIKPFQGESLFELRQTVEPPYIVQEVWPDSASLGILFAPLETVWMGVSAQKLRTDTTNMAELTAPFTMKSHHNYLSAKRTITPLPEDLRTRLLALPPDLKPEIRELSQQVTAGCVSNAQKVTAVTRYFTTQYQYSLRVNIPQGNEPLTYFLLNKPAAHCEFFASGATILLRIAGVPCRYVNGFVVVQRSSFSDYWIANNHDAHAWVEAYDENTGWFIVEATPGEGVPTINEDLNFKDLWNALCFRGPGFQQWLAHLHALLPMSKGVWIVIILIIAALGVWSTFRGLPNRRETFKPSLKPSATALNSLLATMDRRVKAKGFIRVPHETLNHFSKRLLAAEEFLKGVDEHPAPTGTTWFHEAADWYCHYAEVRYSSTEGETAVAQLLESMPNLKD